MKKLVNIPTEEFLTNSEFNVLIAFVETIIEPTIELMNRGEFENAVINKTLNGCVSYVMHKRAGGPDIPIPERIKACKPCIDREIKEAYKDFEDAKTILDKLHLLKSHT